MRKALIIASEVRSGSTFIAESIAYHFAGIFGDVLFNLTKEHFADLNDTTSHSQVLEKFNSLYSDPQGWVATKIMAASLSIVVREARIGEALRQAFFGSDVHWIIVRRRMKVRQAVSLAYARKNGDWHVYSTEQTDAHKPDVTLAETEDALRSILLSDIYLETFAHSIARDRRIEVFYEDFLLEPSSLIEHVYDVLGLARPEGGVKYVDGTKLRQSATGQKRKSESVFNAWLLGNCHPVDTPRTLIDKRAAAIDAHQALEPIATGASAAPIAKPTHAQLDESSTGADELAVLKDRVVTLELRIDELKRLYKHP